MVRVRKTAKGKGKGVFCICRRGEFGIMIECKHCAEWFHIGCVKITKARAAEMTEKNIDYYCPNCQPIAPREAGQERAQEPDVSSGDSQSENDSQASQSRQVLDSLKEAVNTAEAGPSTSRASRPNEPTYPKQDKGKDFDVTKILNHKIAENGRKFLLKLKGYKEPEWFPERNLRGCYNLLENYLKSKDLGPPCIKASVGAVMRPGSVYNSDNFVELEEIMWQAAIYSRSKKYANLLNVEVFSGVLPLGDAILLFNIKNHCVVVLYLPSMSEAYAADGTNEVYSDAKYRKQVEDLIGLPVIPLQFYQQLNTDYCGSSAAALIIEFKRLYRCPEMISEVIRVEPWALAKIRKTLHKGESERESPRRVSISDISFPRCSKCGKLFRCGGRQRLVAHEIKCSFLKSSEA